MDLFSPPERGMSKIMRVVKTDSPPHEVNALAIAMERALQEILKTPMTRTSQAPVARPTWVQTFYE